VKCVTFVSDTFTRYGSNITNVWQEILMPMTLAFSGEVVMKNYENPSIFVKVMAKKISCTFFMWTRCIHSESEKLDPFSFEHNFCKYCPILNSSFNVADRNYLPTNM